MNEGGGAHALRLETSTAHVLAPGRGRGDIAAGPAPAAEATVTATSRAPDTSLPEIESTRPETSHGNESVTGETE